MKVEKIFKKDDISYRITVSMHTGPIYDKCYWSVMYEQRSKGCRKWQNANRNEIPSDWVEQTKDDLIEKIRNTFDKR